MMPKARTSDTPAERTEGGGRREAWGAQRPEEPGRRQEEVGRKTRPGTEGSGPLALQKRSYSEQLSDRNHPIPRPPAPKQRSEEQRPEAHRSQVTQAWTFSCELLALWPPHLT